MTAMTTIVWVRLSNLPAHFWTTDFLASIGYSLGRFVMIDTDRIWKGIFTFALIFVDLDLNRGLPTESSSNEQILPSRNLLTTRTLLSAIDPIIKQVTFKKLVLLLTLLSKPLVQRKILEASKRQIPQLGSFLDTKIKADSQCFIKEFASNAIKSASYVFRKSASLIINSAYSESS